MNIKPQNIKESFDPDIKRFKVPAIIETICPQCKTKVSRDLREVHLSYPSFGGPFYLSFFCECSENGFEDSEEENPYHEWSIKIQLDVTISLLDEGPYY